jgi:hypothetical protein
MSALFLKNIKNASDIYNLYSNESKAIDAALSH